MTTMHNVAMGSGAVVPDRRGAGTCQARKIRSIPKAEKKGTEDLGPALRSLRDTTAERTARCPYPTRATHHPATESSAPRRRRRIPVPIDRFARAARRCHLPIGGPIHRAIALAGWRRGAEPKASTSSSLGSYLRRTVAGEEKDRGSTVVTRAASRGASVRSAVWGTTPGGPIRLFGSVQFGWVQSKLRRDWKFEIPPRH